MKEYYDKGMYGWILISSDFYITLCLLICYISVLFYEMMQEGHAATMLQRHALVTRPSIELKNYRSIYCCIEGATHNT